MCNDRTNNFRTKRKVIQDAFGSLTAADFELKDYVKPSIPYKWRVKSKVLKINDADDYEKTLIDFMESPPKRNKNNSYVIVGVIGSGKSTALKSAMDKAKICCACTGNDLCNHQPVIIYVDFRPSADCTEGSFADFWGKLFLKLEEPSKMADNTEKNEFWQWILTNNLHTKFETENLYKVFDFHRNEIESKEMNHDTYMSIKKRIYEAANEDLFIYKLLKIKFCRRDYNGHCNLVIFDNLDSLPPRLQQKALFLSDKINDILFSKSIIPMRPHTACINHLNNDGATFREVLLHWSPDIFEVIKMKISTIINSSDPEVSQLGTDLLGVYESIISNKLKQSIFEWTCGLSARYALRNFYNFILSPLIYWENNKLAIEKITSNEFYQAYFCSENDPEMYEKNFVNLFSVNQGEYSNIKLRILYHLSISKRAVTVKEVTKKMLLFGYNDIEIYTALNDLLDNRISLIWSDTEISYSVENLNENHILHLTDIGKYYYNDLLPVLLYMRECVTVTDGKRLLPIDEWGSRCWEIFREMEDEDYKEILTYMGKTGNDSVDYQLYYGKCNSLSLMLWDKLNNEHTGFRYYAERLTNIDTTRRNVIEENIKEILQNRMLPSYIKRL